MSLWLFLRLTPALRKNNPVYPKYWSVIKVATLVAEIMDHVEGE